MAIRVMGSSDEGADTPLSADEASVKRRHGTRWPAPSASPPSRRARGKTGRRRYGPARPSCRPTGTPRRGYRFLAIPAGSRGKPANAGGLRCTPAPSAGLSVRWESSKPLEMVVGG